MVKAEWQYKIPERIQIELTDMQYKDFHYVFNSPKYIRSFQKCIKDGIGKKYYINIHVFESIPNPSKMDMTAEVQFANESGTFDVEYHMPGESIETVEKFFESIWKRMECEYYEV